MSRTLSMEPGRYFVRARAPYVMYEGSIEAASGTSRAIELRELRRIDYAQLVRRRGSERTRAHGPSRGGYCSEACQGQLGPSPTHSPVSAVTAAFCQDRLARLRSSELVTLDYVSATGRAVTHMRGITFVNSRLPTSGFAGAAEYQTRG